MRTVSIIGLGYIGLPTALVAAKHGYTVYGYDIDKQKIDALNKKQSPIQEPGIKELLTTNKTFFAQNSLKEANYFIIAVPTPFKNNHEPDLSCVFNAAKTICSTLKKTTNNKATIILESTVPVGTTKKLKFFIEKCSGLKASKDFYLAYCPERVLPGKIIHELIHNDRIIGGICKQSSEKAKRFYTQFIKGNCFTTDDKTAEMVKLIENSSRDIEIALANQISHMCEATNINPFEVIKLANKHPRVNLLQPGCGVGGHCIAVDPWFLIKSFPQQSSILKIARTINDNKPKQIVNKTLHQIKNFIKIYKRSPQILALGLTFKPDTDDLRQSPALFIAKELSKHIKISVLDPFVSKKLLEPHANNKLNPLIPKTNLLSAIKKSDIVIALVKHSIFDKTLQSLTKDEYGLNPSVIKLLSNKIIIDPCGLFERIKLIHNKGNHETAFFREGKSKNHTGPNTTP